MKILMILIRRFSNVTIKENDISPCIEAGAGEGGNNLPIIVVEHEDIDREKILRVARGR